MWTGIVGSADAALGLHASFRQFAARHHLGHDKAGAMSISARAERLIGDARHRRQKHAVANFDAADAQRRAKLGQWYHAQKPSILSDCLLPSQFCLFVQLRRRQGSREFSRFALALQAARDYASPTWTRRLKQLQLSSWRRDAANAPDGPTKGRNNIARSAGGPCFTGQSRLLPIIPRLRE